LIVRGRINGTEQIAGVQGKLDAVWIKLIIRNGLNTRFLRAAKEPDANRQPAKHNA
jgi:hypothetical protein